MVASVSQFQTSINHVVRFKRHTGRTVERVIAKLDYDDLPFVESGDKSRQYEQVPDSAEIVGTLINGLTIALPDFAEPCDWKDLPDHVPAMLCGCCRCAMLPQNCKPATSWRSRSRYSSEPADTRRFAAGESYLFVGQVCEACAAQIRNPAGRATPVNSDLAAYCKGIECGAIAAPYSARFTVPFDAADKQSPIVCRWKRAGETTIAPTRKQAAIAKRVADSMAACEARNVKRMAENAAHVAAERARAPRGRYGYRAA